MRHEADGWTLDVDGSVGHWSAGVRNLGCLVNAEFRWPSRLTDPQISVLLRYQNFGEERDTDCSKE